MLEFSERHKITRALMLAGRPDLAEFVLTSDGRFLSGDLATISRALEGRLDSTSRDARKIIERERRRGTS